MRSGSKLSLLALACGVWVACSAPPVEGTPSGPVEPAESVTYWGQVAPLVSDKCVKCHQAGGIAPFALDSYAAVKEHAAAMAASTRAQRMPPYLMTHDGSCGSFEAAEALSPEEIATLGAWAASKQQEGEAVTLQLPKVASLEGAVALQTPTLVPVAQGGELAAEDEYRCFRVGAPLNHDAFITGYEVLPGNPALVHHVLGFLVDPTKKTENGLTNLEVMDRLDALDPDRVGWPCFGLAGQGVEIDGEPVNWGPGQGPVVYSGQVGVRQRPVHQVIVQVHYNLDKPGVRGQSDTTTVKLRYQDTVSREAQFALWDPLLATLSSTPQLIPPGAASTRLSFTATGASLGLGADPIELLGVLPHMHTRGRKSLLEVTQAGTTSCLAKVDRWDFHWQKLYFYQGAKPQLTAQSELKVTCDYDTSKQTSPIVPGWGTRNEMCLTVLMFAAP